MNPIYPEFALIALGLMALAVPEDNALAQATDELLQRGLPIISVCAARATLALKLKNWKGLHNAGFKSC